MFACCKQPTSVYLHHGLTATPQSVRGYGRCYQHSIESTINAARQPTTLGYRRSRRNTSCPAFIMLAVFSPQIALPTVVHCNDVASQPWKLGSRESIAVRHHSRSPRHRLSLYLPSESGPQTYPQAIRLGRLGYPCGACPVHCNMCTHFGFNKHSGVNRADTRGSDSSEHQVGTTGPSHPRPLTSLPY